MLIRLGVDAEREKSIYWNSFNVKTKTIGVSHVPSSRQASVDLSQFALQR